jgi:hypothetical protein
MKKIISITAALFFSFTSFAQVNLQAVIKPGAKLIYGVEANEQKYDFVVTVKTLTPAVVFDWQMTEPVNRSGTVTHTANAMASGNTMFNYFSGGEKTLDDNTLSVWVSKNVFAGLTKGGKSAMIKMNTNESAQLMAVTEEDPKELQVTVNGEKEIIEEFTAKGQSGEDVYFTFANSAKVPIILRMKNGFYIALKEINTK